MKPGRFQLDVSSLNDGSLGVTVTYGSGAPVVVTVNKDTVAPVAAVIRTLTLVNAANAVAYSVTGTCAANESGEVSVSIADSNNVAVTGVGDCADATWTVSGLDISGLADGSLDVTADYSDAAGNAAPQAPGTVAKDVEAPALGLNDLEDVTSDNEVAYAVSGTCDVAEAGVVTVSIGDGTNAAVTETASCASQAWTVNVDVSDLADGPLDVTADYSDAAGNAAEQAMATVDKS